MDQMPKKGDNHPAYASRTMAPFTF